MLSKNSKSYWTILKVFTSTPASLTWREHDSGERKTGPLHISPLPVRTLKEEKVVCNNIAVRFIDIVLNLRWEESAGQT